MYAPKSHCHLSRCNCNAGVADIDLHFCSDSSNKLAGIPAGIEQLSLLRSLSLSHNPLTTISEAIAQLPALASLSCSNCELQQLPQQLGRHQPVLSAVSAGGNKLQHLPAGLRSATALVKLDLQSNQLEGLEADMLACWPNLAELNLSQNRLLVSMDSYEAG